MNNPNMSNSEEWWPLVILERNDIDSIFMATVCDLELSIMLIVTNKLLLESASSKAVLMKYVRLYCCSKNALGHIPLAQ